MNNENAEISVINGVKVWQEGDITHFEPIESETEAEKELKEKEKDNRSWFGKLVDWWKGSKVKPYVKVRDLADPFDDRKHDIFDSDAGSDGATGAEIGIRIDF